MMYFFVPAMKAQAGNFGLLSEASKKDFITSVIDYLNSLEGKPQNHHQSVLATDVYV